MEYGIPDGQMELRLQDVRYAGLEVLEVDPWSTVTAAMDLPDGNFYLFKVSPGGAGLPMFTWQEVTVGYYKLEADSVETIRTESPGPPRGLTELLDMDDPDSDLGMYWREAATALIGLQAFVEDSLEESAEEAAQAARNSVAERLTGQFREQAEEPPMPSVRDSFDAFRAACQQRAPYCTQISLAWDQLFDERPDVWFGIAVNTPGQVLYKVDSGGGLYLNGFWTASHRLEEDLLEQFPTDDWARVGAGNAANDLLEIQRTARELMEAQKQTTLQEMDRSFVEERLEAMLNGRPVATEVQTSLRSRGVLGYACESLWEKIKEYLISIRPQPGISVDEYDISGLV